MRRKHAFLLGVWHYIIMNRSEYNLNGAATYNEWYPNGSKSYKGTIGNSVDYDITVKCSFIPEPECDHSEPKAEPEEDDFPDEAETQQNSASPDRDQSSEPKVVNQYFSNPTVVYQNGEKNVHVDHVDVLNT